MPWSLRTDVYRLSARHAAFNNGSPPAEGWRLSLGGSVACCRRLRRVPQSSPPSALTSRLSRLRLCRESPKGGQSRAFAVGKSNDSSAEQRPHSADDCA